MQAGLYNATDIAKRFPLRTLAEATGKPPYYGDAGIRGFRNYSAIDVAMNYSYDVIANCEGAGEARPRGR